MFYLGVLENGVFIFYIIVIIIKQIPLIRSFPFSILFTFVTYLSEKTALNWTRGKFERNIELYLVLSFINAKAIEKLKLIRTKNEIFLRKSDHIISYNNKKS